MLGLLDLSTSDLTSSCVKLLDELVFIPQCHAGKTFYHMEVPSRSQFFRIGYAEYVLLSLLDGKTTFAQAVTRMVRALGADALPEPRALQVYTWAVENRLTRFVDQGGAIHPTNSIRPLGWQQLLTRLNPLFIKLPLFQPNRLLTILLPWLGWLFSPLCTVLGVALMIAAVGVVGIHWDRFCLSAKQVLSRDNWLWLGVAWIVLKLLHELAHGLVAKKYRGQVSEFGIIIAFLAPSAYVDVTSCWRFASKWQRIHVAIAGMFFEMVLAALATFAWAQTTSPVWQHLLYDVIIMASVSTFFFNANPLMRLDGYYILSDLLEIPNLAQAGQRRLREAAGWLFLGSPSGTPRSLGFRGWLIWLYGYSAAFWRILVSASLLVAAAAIGKGAGIALWIAAVGCWFGPLTIQTFAMFRQTYRESRLICLRAASVLTLMLGLLTAAWYCLPWPGTVSVPGIIDYKDTAIVRSRTAGFVQKVRVSDGQSVAAGELLLELCNEELENELHSLELEIKQENVRRRVAQDKQNAADQQIATRNRQAAEERLAELQRRVAALHVYAPMAGRVVARNLEHRLATYVKEGDELLAIGDETRKEFIVSLPQQPWEEVSAWLGRPVKFRIGPRLLAFGVLERIEPRATIELPHPALSAEVGGPLPVTQTKTENGTSQTRLVEPRFRAIIALPADGCPNVTCGEQGHAILGWSQHRFGDHLWWVCTQWVKERLKTLQS